VAFARFFCDQIFCDPFFGIENIEIVIERQTRLQKIKIQKTFGIGKIKIVKKNNVACC
jgi:hypothetical protein